MIPRGFHFCRPDRPITLPLADSASDLASSAGTSPGISSIDAARAMVSRFEDSVCATDGSVNAANSNTRQPTGVLLRHEMRLSGGSLGAAVKRACGLPLLLLLFCNAAKKLHVTDVVPVKLGLEAIGKNDPSRGDPMAPRFRLETLSGDRIGQGRCT